MEGTEKIFSGKSRDDVDAQFRRFLDSAPTDVWTLGMEYREPDNESGQWQLIFNFHITSVEDPCTVTARK
ncbi:MAG: hypothetical protein A2921_03750 [Candidatus Magasanikbacteria bacterium RIFCSPLOWO2_01_FULL_43_20b]|uniref:Uncharacterized protein n=1 Tax=Candidatus Magasanikbacteria bacterium RIFCSPLOWO2_12_FULL_43_12 TaxID=1798692 RepID=A0A1F6MR26_9BACT|nr:MAG: hypothetical protein A3C74_00055 [Candidatus Magasanikbacteria bacterium RIFCSPHIGHO2_02_FULL_44_13]OGH72516.1 MAG: hypothetical protein A3I93_04340 [Candidatus Magasanikbacteria bacterium RIFCSPLOWO2_02_FULL_43_22]OGH73687.1 MAG: hypothetical protein A2921_03750 [Candidatus Magasanikbacteria bacterium RIFCSPLOWO2_01_FULL_43_20b]OGH74101.1 MAG: hypothetical protein A3G00_05010 [Candidatus Magasanikbacteria bacterium RIFCSPLOWO2_12_FULL_43_12]